MASNEGRGNDNRSNVVIDATEQSSAPALRGAIKNIDAKGIAIWEL
jgi:hypothetical protein